MTPKYIPASLLMVLRILGTFTPRYNGLMSHACATMSVKTTMSKGTSRPLILGMGIRKSDKKAYRRRERWISERWSSLLRY